KNLERITVGGTATKVDAGFKDGEYLTSGPDGKIWITDQGADKIVQYDPVAGTYNTYNVSTSGSGLDGIAVGPDGALWFTEDANKIGRITTTGTIIEYSIPTASSGPEFIVTGADGALWFTEQDVNKIGRITTGGVFTEYVVPTSNSAPHEIAAGP